MNLPSVILTIKKSDTNKYMLCDIIEIKFQNGQMRSVMIEIRMVGAWGASDGELARCTTAGLLDTGWGLFVGLGAGYMTMFSL